MKGISIFKSQGLIPVTIAVVVSVFMVVATVQATTTISTDITTGGSLTVSSGDTSLQHASTTQLSNSGVAWFTGDTTLGHASTTQISVSGASWHTGDASFGHASTTMFSNIQTSNTATTTAYLGCVQTYATTTSQPIKLVFYASTSVASVGNLNLIGTSAGNTAGAAGYVLFAFGYCP